MRRGCFSRLGAGVTLLLTLATNGTFPSVAASEAPEPRRIAERHADAGLEALLPSSLGGVALTVESQAGTDLSTQSAAFDAFLAALGKSRSEFSVASAYAREGGLKAEIGAWRVRGADSAALLPSFKAALQASSQVPLTVADEAIAGRPVTRIGDPGQLARGPLYVVVRGETLLFVETTVPALATEAIGKLPR